jgi:anti-sigma-K factor RskA
MQQAELIIAYLKGALPEAENRAFEQRLAAEPELAAAVKDYRTILRGFQGLRHAATRQEIAGWNTAEDPDDEEVMIMAYVQGKMEPAVLEAFERAIARDAALKKRVEDQRAIMQGFKGLQHESFAEEVARWAASLPAAETQAETRVVPLRSRSGRWRYAAAAAVLVLIAAAFWLLAPGGEDPYSYTAFLEENYIEPADPADRGEAQAVLSMAIQDFNRENFDAASESLRAVPAEDSLFVLARYWLGHSLLKAERYQDAASAFGESLTAANDGAYDLTTFNRDNASWSRILAQLGVWNEDQSPAAREQLRSLLDTFLETADRSDTYYERGLQLQEYLGTEE